MPPSSDPSATAARKVVEAARALTAYLSGEIKTVGPAKAFVLVSDLRALADAVARYDTAAERE